MLVFCCNFNYTKKPSKDEETWYRNKQNNISFLMTIPIS